MHINPVTRVAFAHYSRPNDIGGVTSWLVHLTRELQHQGVQVAVHLHHEGSNPSESSLAQTLSEAGVTTFSVNTRNSLVEDVRNTLAFLNSWQPAVFFPQCIPAHFIAAAMAGRQGLPWALTVHSDDPQYWSILQVIRPVLQGGRTVCVSPYLAREVQRLGFDKDPSIIPYGVSAPAQYTSYGRDHFQVVFSGRVEEYQKRISLVVESLITACRQNSRIRATIIGDGVSLQESLQKVKDSDLERAIRFTGRVDASQVLDLLAGTQAILFMSDFEGLPVALLEAMAQGVVPVARWIPSGIPDVVLHEQTGLLVSDDPSEAAAAILRLASDHVLWNQCSHASRELVGRKYLLPHTTSLWRDLINSLAMQSAISYPITPWLLPLRATIAGRRIEHKWKYSDRMQRRIRWQGTVMARFKHQLKRTLYSCSVMLNH